MIIVSIYCQMGNQMFQYAFAKAVAKRFHSFFLPYQSNYYYPFKLNYFKLDAFTRLVFSNPRLTRQYSRICRKLIRHVTKKRVMGDNEKMTSDFTNNTYYEGFFQSDKYWESIKDKIVKSFRIKKKYTDEFKHKYGLLLEQNKIIVVHVRRTDYKEVEFEGLGGVGIDLSVHYYEKALADIANKEQYKIIFISDDIESVKRDFGHIKNSLFENNPAIIDFQLIQHADIAIIANSTFAWWAAFLSKKEESTIFAPKYWLGFKVKKEYPQGIHTNKFKWVDF